MKRREFIKGSAAAATLPFWLQSCDFLSRGDFPVHVRSDHGVGHLMMESLTWPETRGSETDFLIVGGGLAGLASAYSLRDKDYQLFELSDRMGGSSGALEKLNISQGAHYELAYPDGYGQEVLTLLEELNIIRYEAWKGLWTFVDHQHVIPYARRQQCYDHGEIRSEVIRAGSTKDQFYELMNAYKGKMPLPTRLIEKRYRALNDLTFLDFLRSGIDPDPDFIRQMDYHMMDDWGGRADQVSALAGIHYFMCRPYLEKSVDLFSPPEGNAYFARKIIDRLDSDRIHTRHLISGISKTQAGFEVEVMDISSKKRKIIRAAKVFYAGQKHTLKYVYPKEANLFAQEQAPWMIMNFITDQEPGRYGYWQNEYLGENPAFLGFIDSSVQDQQSLGGKRVLTAYYCLKPEERDYLVTIPENGERIAGETLRYLQTMLKTRLKVNACHINVMGHAMSIPKPGFLFNDANSMGTDLIYAGVDNGRLPLLFEALDSGLHVGTLL